MNTTTRNITDLIAKLRQKQAALGDASDVPNTQRAQAAFLTTQRAIASTITGLMNPGLDKPLRLLAECEERRAAVLARQAEIEQALAEAPAWREHPDARERDRRYDHIEHVKRQRQMLRDGTLLSAPGVTYERLTDIEARIAELNTKIAGLRDRLDGHLKQAQVLLDEPLTVAG